MLLALSANSPFWQGRDSGLASARTPVFQTFPRAGLPRRFTDYADYVEAVDVLVRCDAIPEPTFLWWDARLQPRLGTLEVRIMDAQSRMEDTTALVALVQCLVHREATSEPADATPPEVLDENRFLAARDGMRADWSSRPPAAGCRWPAGWRRCSRPARRTRGSWAAPRSWPRAADLAKEPGEARQRALAAGPEGLPGVLRGLHAEFASSALRA